MWDLIIGVVILTGLSFYAFLAGLRVARWRSQRGTLAICAIVLAALLLFVSRFHGTWQMARLISFSNAVVLANWIPVGGAFFAGVTWAQKNSPRWRRAILAGLILLVSVYSVLCCFQGGLPLDDSFTNRPDNAAPQSQPSSCGPCCAALLLRHHGIGATEREMVRLCLTTYRGCPALGLYRGLKLKTAGTDWNVEVVSCSVDELLDMRGPLLLRIVIPPMRALERNHLTKERRSYQHVVLLFGIDDKGFLSIVDPAVREGLSGYWRVENLHEQWLGEALRLVPRRNRLPNVDLCSQFVTQNTCLIGRSCDSRWGARRHFFLLGVRRRIKQCTLFDQLLAHSSCSPVSERFSLRRFATHRLRSCNSRSSTIPALEHRASAECLAPGAWVGGAWPTSTRS